MYAIVNIKGQQFKVAQDQQLYVHRLQEPEGTSVDFNEVLLVENNGKTEVGSPLVSGAKVTLKILSHMKGDKVLVFKKKRRKTYQKMNGHRQYLSKVQVEGIHTKDGSSAPAKKAAKPAKKVVAEAATEVVETKPKTVKKATTAKKTTTKKKDQE